MNNQPRGAANARVGWDGELGRLRQALVYASRNRIQVDHGCAGLQREVFARRDTNRRAVDYENTGFTRMLGGEDAGARWAYTKPHKMIE
jgi:hypothetical protein